MRFSSKVYILLIVALFISVCFKCFPAYLLVDNRYLSNVYELIQYDLRLQYFFFFVFGIWLKTNIEKFFKGIMKSWLWLLIAAGGGTNVLLFLAPNTVVGNVWYFCFNTLYLIAMCSICQNDCLPRNKFLEFIGGNSYAFYLWHVVGKIAVVVLIGDDNRMLYYACSVAVLVLECIVIYYGNRFVYVRRMLFGNTK